MVEQFRAVYFERFKPDREHWPVRKRFASMLLHLDKFTLPDHKIPSLLEDHRAGSKNHMPKKKQNRAREENTEQSAFPSYME